MANSAAALAMPETQPKRILNVGCGRTPFNRLHPDWVEIRLDIDPATSPHIVASMMDMGDIGKFDAIYCCHALEHIYPHEVPVALAEFFRVLAPGSHAIMMVPDLEGIPADETVLFVAPEGPVCGLDLIYGDRREIPHAPHMAHHMGFVQRTLADALALAGFVDVTVQRCHGYNLAGVGIKPGAPT